MLSYSSTATWADINPTAAWQTYHDGLNVFATDVNDRAPVWANVAVFEFRMINFVGGAGAPEGGNYSLYFDDIFISKW
ncbi:hypothetical protein D3C84_1139000 [compost metagenome]